MTLNFDNRKTKVQQLTEFIHNKIIAREIRQGESLPSINQLSREHQVSRDTVYKALNNLKEQGVINSSHGKSFYVTSESIKVLLLLDEYSQFKEIFYQSLLSVIPESVQVDLIFHQYNHKIYKSVIESAPSSFSKYLIMNYDNEELSKELLKVDKSKLLLLDFGNFDKQGASFLCQCFGENFYQALVSIEDDLNKYNELVLLINKRHRHPATTKEWFVKFCSDKNISYQIREDINDRELVKQGSCYIVVKQEDIVDVIKQARSRNMQMKRDYGLIAYNDMPFYDVIDKGISAITIDWQDMGRRAAQFIVDNKPIHRFMPSYIVHRNSF